LLTGFLHPFPFHPRRNQQPVFIDYRNQFNGTAAASTGGAGTTTATGRGRAAAGGTGGSGRGRATKGRAKRGGAAGNWTTLSDGTRAFITSGGQQLSGAAAFMAYKSKGKAKAKKRSGGGRGRGRRKAAGR
jgi:hypothetical protein